jgi:hypothetical protein
MENWDNGPPGRKSIRYSAPMRARGCPGSSDIHEGYLGIPSTSSQPSLTYASYVHHSRDLTTYIPHTLRHGTFSTRHMTFAPNTMLTSDRPNLGYNQSGTNTYCVPGRIAAVEDTSVMNDPWINLAQLGGFIGTYEKVSAALLILSRQGSPQKEGCLVQHSRCDEILTSLVKQHEDERERL